MASVTDFVVVPFSKGDEDKLVPGEAKEVQNGEWARRLAQSLAAKQVGAIVFSRTEILTMAPAAKSG